MEGQHGGPNPSALFLATLALGLNADRGTSLTYAQPLSSERLFSGWGEGRYLPHCGGPTEALPPSALTATKAFVTCGQQLVL